MLNICITPHPTEDRPCTTPFRHDLNVCPQCGGTAFVPENEFEKIMAELATRSKADSRMQKDTTQKAASA